MSKRILVGLLAPCFFFACSSSRGQPQSVMNNGARLTFKGPSTDLQRTSVVQTLDAPIPEGENAIWCASFPLAWERLEQDVLGEPPIVIGAEEIVERLNKASSFSREVPDDSSYAVAGIVRDGIVKTIEQEMERRFGQVPDLPEDLPQDAAVAYSYLFTKVPFTIPFFDAPGEIFFRRPDGSSVKVDAFGLRYADMYGYTKLRKQVDVLYYSGHGNEAEFVVDPCKTTREVQVVLAVVEPEERSLAALVETVEERIAKETVPHGQRSLADGEVFLAPNIHFDITHRVSELEGQSIGNEKLKGIPIVAAIQSIRFKLDRSGVELESEARIIPAAINRTLIFERPFLVYLKKRGGERPFFAAWIENTELLAVEKGTLSNEERARRGREIAKTSAKRCNDGSVDDCYKLSRWYRDGTYESNFVIEKNPQQALHFTEKSCVLKMIDSCYSLGRMYEYGRHIERSYEKALQAYERSCPVIEESCANIGRLYENGRGVDSRDYAKARHYYELACTKHTLNGCAPLGSLYLRGRGSEQDPMKAKSCYEKVCRSNGVTREYVSGCAGLGLMYEKGLGVPKSIKTAIKHYQHSCEITKNRDACQSLERLRDGHDMER